MYIQSAVFTGLHLPMIRMNGTCPALSLRVLWCQVASSPQSHGECWHCMQLAGGAAAAFFFCLPSAHGLRQQKEPGECFPPAHCGVWHAPRVLAGEEPGVPSNFDSSGNKHFYKQGLFMTSSRTTPCASSSASRNQPIVSKKGLVSASCLHTVE